MPDGSNIILSGHSLPYIERRPDRYFWTAREVSLLKATYPEKGMIGCLEVLPRRTPGSIYQKARQLNIVRPGVSRNRVPYESSEYIDQAIRRAYESGEKGAIKHLSMTLGRPMSWIRQRAMKLGIAVPRFKPEPWSAAEDAILSERAHRRPGSIRKALLSAGFSRTETAIAVRIKRLRLDTSDPDHYTARGLAMAFGVDSHTIAKWIGKGWLQAKRRGTNRVEQQGGDEWWIARKHVRSFVIENVAAVDFRKVEKFWLVSLLTE